MQNLDTLDNYQGKIESTEVEIMYLRKIAEADFWLMLHLASSTYLLPSPARLI